MIASDRERERERDRETERERDRQTERFRDVGKKGAQLTLLEKESGSSGWR